MNVLDLNPQHLPACLLAQPSTLEGRGTRATSGIANSLMRINLAVDRGAYKRTERSGY